MMRNTYFVLFLALFCFLPSLGIGQFSLVAGAIDLGSGEYELTPAIIDQKGAVWANTPIDLNKHFEVSAKIFYGDGSGNNGGADGLAFVLQTTGTGAIGDFGGNIGYQNGISPYFAAEFRTYRDDKIKFLSSAGGSSSTSVLPPADNQYHDFRFVWSGKHHVAEVYFDGVLAVSYNYDIVGAAFSGTSMATFGFTAATGGEAALHKVKDISLNYQAVPTMSEWGLILLALLLLNMGVLAMVMKGTLVTTSGAKFSLGSVSLPFDKKQYGAMLVLAGGLILSAFALAILGFGYEVTSADIPGSILALPLVAYLLHLVFRK